MSLRIALPTVNTTARARTVPTGAVEDEYHFIVKTMRKYHCFVFSLSLAYVFLPPLVQEGADPVEPKEKEKPPGQAHGSVATVA